MIRYTVTATIQSRRIDNGEPVDVKWYTGTSLAKAVSAMTSAATHDEDTDHGNLPKAMRYRTTAVRMDTEALPEPEVLTYQTTFDDDSTYPLDACAWYDNKYQPWTRFDCWGRMAEVTMLRNGETVTKAILCEGHVNAFHKTEA